MRLTNRARELLLVAIMLFPLTSRGDDGGSVDGNAREPAVRQAKATDPVDDELQVAMKAAQTEAQAKSRDKDYAGAAAEYEAFLEAHGKIDARHASYASRARDIAKAYRERARLSAESGKSVKAARALLLDLLGPSTYGVEHAETIDDPRAAELLAALKVRDPTLAGLLGRREVKVIVTTADGKATPEIVQLVADGILESLRKVGVKASPLTGSEQITWTVSQVKQGNLGALMHDPRMIMNSCHVEANGRWTTAAGDLVVGGITSGKTALHIDLDTCFRRAAQVVGDGASTSLVKALLRASSAMP